MQLGHIIPIKYVPFKFFHCWKNWRLKIHLCHFAVLWRSYSFKAKALNCIRNINICQKYVCNQHSELGKHPYAERLVQHVFKFKHIFKSHERKLDFSISPCIGCCTYSAGEISGSSNELNTVPIFPKKKLTYALKYFLGKHGISVYAQESF